MLTIGRIRVLALGLVDITSLCVVWVITVLGYRLLGGSYNPVLYLHFWPVAVAFLLTNTFLGLYHGNVLYPSAPHSPVEEFRRLCLSSAFVHIGVIAFLAFRYQTTDGYSRVVISVSGLLVAILSQSFRNWLRILLSKARIAQIPVLMAGGGEVAIRVAAVLKDNPYFGFRVVGYFDGTKVPKTSIPDLKCLGTLKDVVPEAKRRDIKILLACQDTRLFRMQMKEFAGWFSFIEYLPTAQSFPIFGSRAISIDGIGGLEMVNQGRMKVKRIQKRIMDLTLAVVTFIILSPLFVLLPILIKLTSRGHVFYRQDRLGKEGHLFKVWKFRSMYDDAETRLKKVLADDPKLAEEWRRNFKLTCDPRVTPFGKFLRKTSLDELPQLFNVLVGDMALIGPRPIVEGEIKYYADAYKVVSSVRPGVTGLWQVSGRSDTDYARRVALDTYYVLNWSPWMDIWILVRTVYAVLLMRGAR